MRAYAAHRGCSHTAVRKALQTGRITALDDGTIDPERADREWAAKTDPSAQRGKHAKAMQVQAATITAKAKARNSLEAVPQAALDVVEGVLREGGFEEALGGDGEGDEAEGGVTFLRARMAKEYLQAQLLAVRLAQQKGELVDRERATAAIFDLARRERDAWLSWPARIGALLAGEFGVDPHAMEQALGRAVREHLAEIGDGKLELR